MEEHTHRRRPYTKPRLTVYGAVTDLTAGGTGNASETVSKTSGKAIPRPG